MAVKPRVKYDSDGNKYEWSTKSGTWVRTKGAVAVKREEAAAAKTKTVNEVANYKKDDSARAAMAARRAKNQPAKPATTTSSAKSRLQGTTNQTAKFIKGKKPETTPTPTTTPQPIASTSSKSSSSSSSSSKASKPATKKPVVSQSKTMYVKKGDMVNGKEVKKGYVAQYGKPERKVTGVVKLVVDTTRGKAGSKVEVKKGRYNKKGK
jgi:hypothetical protein